MLLLVEGGTLRLARLGLHILLGPQRGRLSLRLPDGPFTVQNLQVLLKFSCHYMYLFLLKEINIDCSLLKFKLFKSRDLNYLLP